MKKLKKDEKPKAITTMEEAFEKAQRAQLEPAATEQLPDAASAFGALSTRPIEPQSITVQGESGAIRFACGLYLVTAGAGVGKSVAARAIAYAAQSAGFATIALYMFEALAPAYPEVESRALFTDPERFLFPPGSSDLELYLSTVLSGRDTKSKPLVLVLDSISDALRSYMGERRKGMTASKDGMQAADKMFATRLNSIGEQRNVIILGLINAEQVPFADRLYGATQGLINVLTASRFRKKDRVTARRASDYTLSSKAVEAALRDMRYEVSDDSAVASSDMKF